MFSTLSCPPSGQAIPLLLPVISASGLWRTALSGVLGQAGADSVQAHQAWAGLCHPDMQRKAERKEPAERGEAGWPSQPADPLSPSTSRLSGPFQEWEQSGAGLLSPDLGGGADGHLCLGGNMGWG